MKKMKKLSYAAIFAGAVSLLFSCERDVIEPFEEAGNSMIVVNEGPFQSGSGSLTVVDRNTLETTSEVFHSANGRPLGNIVQSAAVHNEKVYVCVNNSNRLEVASAESFTSISSVEMDLPRYFVAHSVSKGYVSSWNDEVYVIDLNGNVVIDTIDCPTGPDLMAIAEDKLFVLNSGGFGADNRISVIDTGTDEMAGTITVGDNPSGVVVDKDGKLWVLCSGKGWNGFPMPDDTPGSLHLINPVTLEVEKTISFDDPAVHPTRMKINPDLDMLYILFPDGVHTMGINASTVQGTPLFNGIFYGLDVDHSSGNIYMTDPVDYTQNGWVKIYQPDGRISDSVRVGVIPSSVIFP